ncbi:PIN domain-containing protein [Amycolatopsis aidingensis]|uniref:PIN domain-containing protein n=1 Tax=Amycolatopsis aidingensis TaxID=2842453 RepID=UPI001C0B7802|nr:PIN domain-containing protein [Amycolatopsis aidingensis]
MHRAVLDSNAIDPIADNAGAYEAVRAAIDDGRLQLLCTHVSIDELCEIPDVKRRARLILLLVALGELVSTGAVVNDHSKLNFCRLIDNDDVNVMAELRSGNIRHTRDALIAATARYENASLITNEHRLTRRAREQGIEVLTPRELLDEVGFSV